MHPLTRRWTPTQARVSVRGVRVARAAAGAEGGTGRGAGRKRLRVTQKTGSADTEVS